MSGREHCTGGFVRGLSGDVTDCTVVLLEAWEHCAAGAQACQPTQLPGRAATMHIFAAHSGSCIGCHANTVRRAASMACFWIGD